MAEYDKTINDAATMRGMDSALGHIDQYELVRELGGGGFGTVYLAKDTVAGIDVAVKGLPPIIRNNADELERIRENFALVSRLHHPYIAAALHLQLAREVHYVSEDARQKLRVMPGDTLMVMEYAPGVTLSKWRKQFPGGKVPLEQAIQLVWQVAQALDYAHEQHIIHRDIKPSNIMVETKPDGETVARLLDFGLAAEIRSSMGRVSQEVRDTSGTRPYMAPEQWLAEKQGPATDQYALAVMFHELLTGEVPFASVFDTGDPVMMMNIVGNKPFVADGELPKIVRLALAKALAKKPEGRFTSCGEFVKALEGNISRGGAETRRGGRAALVAAVLAIAALAGGVWWMRAGNGTNATNGTNGTPPPQVPVVPPVSAVSSVPVQLWEGGPYWANRNIGAEKPEDYGYYFWWGDTVGYKRVNGEWVASDGSSSNFSFCDANAPTCGKSNATLQSEGWITADGVLAPIHDAAHVQWGGGWRMPTDEEIRDLNNKCTWTWTTMNGVRGYVVRGRGNHASASIFFPVAGWGLGTSLYLDGLHGDYWSSVPDSDYSYYAWRLDFRPGSHGTDTYSRNSGRSVRPVQGFSK